MNWKSGARFSLALIKAHLFKKSCPLLVQISVTNRCNGRCAYCNIFNRSQRELSTQEILSLVEELATLGTQRINIFGGEPLLREDIGTIVRAIKKNGMLVIMLSNGFLVPARIKEIEEVDIIQLSLDGAPPTHDLLRGKGSFDKVVAAVVALQTTRIPIQTNTVLTRHNIGEIDFILEFARSHHCTAFFQPLQHNAPVTGDTIECLADKVAYQAAFKKLIFEKKRGAPIFYSQSTFEFMLKWPDYTISRMNARAAGLFQKKCWSGRLFCNIDTNGDVYPCCQTVEEFRPKNFLEVGFKEAWDNLKTNICDQCSAPCYIEYNRLFSLKPGAVYNLLRMNPLNTFTRKRVL